MSFTLVLLVAAAVAQPIPPIKPSDGTELFQGDGSRILFDPACRDFTVESVKTAPACAMRVAKGETAASLAIASNTLKDTPQDALKAVAVLEKAIAAENHPAAHYLLGVFLGTGQQIVPRYADAARHLEIASARGNPAAADLLGDLIVEGKGTARNIPGAVAQYEKAMAGGFTGSAVKLAMLYLNGRYRPVDKDYGARLLSAAAAAGNERAQQLSALASTDNIHNFQLLPSDDDNKVEVKEFGTFDNPEIPPNFGFDEAFQAVHYQPFDNQAVLVSLENRAATGPTPYLYELARRLGPSDPQRALRTYLLARTRMTYDASRCSDPSAFQAVRAWDMLIGKDIAFTLSAANRNELIAQAASALKEEARLSGSDRPWWVCRSGINEMSAAIAGKVKPLELKPESEWPAARAKARAGLEAVVRQKPQ